MNGFIATYRRQRGRLLEVRASVGYFLASKQRQQADRSIDGECGASLVEFALSAAIYFSLLLGVIQMGMALYTYNFVAEAARDATRYAAVRGSQSCSLSSTFPNCNLLPNASGNPLKAYVQSLGYPGSNAGNLTVTSTWWEPTTTSGHKSWTTSCTGATDASGNACNLPGNMVKVVVTENYTLSIPFVPRLTLPVSSASEMMISE